jgi:Ca2+-binding RTX toxin-like protein
MVLASAVGATALTGGFSPTIIGGGADVNGDLVVNVADDANAFYGDTSIIDGGLDCDAWGANANDGSAGDGVIDANDDCALVGYDGTRAGVTIKVQNGVFQVANGPLPTVFNADQPNNPDIGDSDFAWSAIDGRVDSNGNEVIDGNDCHVGVVGALDVLGNNGTNPCGMAPAPNSADNGLVDFNDDSDITGVDSCSDRCFFGHNVVLGKVQEVECPGHENDPRPDVIGTPGADTLRGTGSGDVICGLGGNDTLLGRGGRDLLLGGRGHDTARGGRGADTVRGGRTGDSLFGNRGNDVVLGGRGNDAINGGRGIDTCRGGPGTDVVVRCEFH